MKRVFLKFHAPALTEDLMGELRDGVILSCGAGDDQLDGYDMYDPRSKLKIVHCKTGGYDITFSAHSQHLEDLCNWWLSPALDSVMENDIIDWGLQ
jgi:hypothetical protein